MKPEYIRTSLKKMWLEDFYSFCEEEVLIIMLYIVITNF